MLCSPHDLKKENLEQYQTFVVLIYQGEKPIIFFDCVSINLNTCCFHLLFLNIVVSIFRNQFFLALGTFWLIEIPELSKLTNWHEGS